MILLVAKIYETNHNIVGRRSETLYKSHRFVGYAVNKSADAMTVLFALESHKVIDKHHCHTHSHKREATEQCVANHHKRVGTRERKIFVNH